MSTFYDNAGIGETATKGLERAEGRVIAAVDRVQRKPPAPLPDVEREPWPELPRSSDGEIGIVLEDSYGGTKKVRLTVTGDRKPEWSSSAYGQEHHTILTRLMPSELLGLTIRAEIAAEAYEALAERHEARLAKAIEDALVSEEPALRALAERVKAEAEEKARKDAERRQRQEESDAKEQARKATLVKYATDKAAWIREYGSERLKRCLDEQIECDAIYRTERLAHERPGWAYYADVDGDCKDPRNPPADAFDLLDEARKLEPKAELVFWYVEHKHDEFCVSGDEECPRYETTTYAAIAPYLDDETDIVYMKKAE